MIKSTITRLTAVAVGVGLLGGAAAYGQLDRGDPKAGPTRLALANPTNAEDVVVVVNGHEVTQGEVERELEAMLGSQMAMIPPEQQAGVRSQLQPRIVDGVIVKTLLEQAAREQGIEVTDSQVADSMKEIEAALPEGRTLKDYAEALGTTQAAMARDLALGLRIDELMARQVKDVPSPTGEEVAAFYEENDAMFQVPERAEVSHILIAVAEDADDATRAEKRKEAEKVAGELEPGDADAFATVAGKRSDCPSREKGGKLGRLARGDTVPAFEQAVFSQKVGEVGPVVETPFGYHVIRVDQIVPAGKVSLTEVQTFVEQRLQEEREKAALASFVETLRAKASIVYPEEEAA